MGALKSYNTLHRDFAREIRTEEESIFGLRVHKSMDTSSLVSALAYLMASGFITSDLVNNRHRTPAELAKIAEVYLREGGAR